jgi:hypothetical protein
MYNLGISSISSNSVNNYIIPINIGTAFGGGQNNIGSLDGLYYFECKASGFKVFSVCMNLPYLQARICFSVAADLILCQVLSKDV